MGIRVRLGLTVLGCPHRDNARHCCVPKNTMFSDRDMDRILQMLKWVALTFIAWWLTLSTVIHLLLIMQVLDIIGGVLLAAQRGQVSSRAFGEGWRRKAYTWLIVVAVFAIQGVFAEQFPVAIGTLTPAEVVAAGFIFMEAISILENGVKLGVPVPKWLVTALAEGRRRFNGDSDNGK